MREELISPEDLAYRLENEGIAYAILNYYGKVKSTDKKAEELWNNAYDALSNLEKYLEETLSNEVKNQDK